MPWTEGLGEFPQVMKRVKFMNIIMLLLTSYCIEAKALGSALRHTGSACGEGFMHWVSELVMNLWVNNLLIVTNFSAKVIMAIVQLTGNSTSLYPHCHCQLCHVLYPYLPLSTLPLSQPVDVVHELTFVPSMSLSLQHLSSCMFSIPWDRAEAIAYTVRRSLPRVESFHPGTYRPTWRCHNTG